jgi:nucleotide-binding universal stress UspA family protein
MPGIEDYHVLAKSLEDVAYYQKIAQQKLTELAKGLAKGIEVNIELERGLAVDTILARAKNRVDLIVMGNRRADNILDSFFGSISSQIARRANCPVICVPAEFDIDKKRWVLAWDLTKFADLTPILPLLQLIKAAEIKLDIVNVSKHPKSLLFKNSMAEANIDRMKAIFESHQIDYSFEIIKGESTEESLADYAKEHGIGALIVIPKKHDWVTKLFGKSYSKEIIEHLNLPIISVPSIV